ncbi:MAG TPA: ABC transporter permease [Candidatus Sulfotelmatobacter sp.]|nr:ABC transporter permease [Candidatus Sulfotelmatobacter sp.]
MKRTVPAPEAAKSWRFSRPLLLSLWADLKLTVYQLGKSPGFTATVIVTLALGIGANTAIFSVIDTVLLKPLSYPNPDRIVQFLLSLPAGARPGSSIADFRLWREQTRAFQDVSAYDFTGVGLSLTGDVPEEVRAVHVTADYFRLFGASTFLGQTFTTEETNPNRGNVVVLSYGLWKSRFNSDPKIVGKPVSLNHVPYTVLGVTEQNFQSDPAADLWIPFQFALNSNDPSHYFQVAGRLKPGITLKQANAQLKLAAAEAVRSYSFEDADLGFEVKPLRDMIVGDAQLSLLMMAVAVGLVLLIACANVANLLLVRATGRKREFAIRSALGAGRIRIVRQLLTESIVLSLIGGALGLVVGLAGVRALLALNPGNIPRIGESGFFVGGFIGLFIGIDWRLLVFAIALSLLTGILFGLFPALSVSRPDLNSSLKESGNQQGAGSGQNRARSLLVISQVSVAVVLLIGAALLIRTFIVLREVKTGFDPHNVLRIDMSLAGNRLAKTADVSAFVDDARLRINAIPGVEDSAMTCCPPFTSRFGLPFVVVGRSLGNSSRTGDAEWMSVSPGYFDVFRIPIVRGRDFIVQDSAAAPPVVLINEAMARQFWPNQNPLGEQIVIGNDLGPRFKDVPRQIIGIVGDTRDDDLSSPAAPAMIIPQAQQSNEITAFWSQFGPSYWLVRTRVTPHQMASLAAKQLSDASGGLAVGHIESMDEVMSSSISRQNFNMLLLTLFAAVALVLATVGIYGVVSYVIVQRSREIGVRMALGAGRTNIRNLVLRQGMLLAIVGVLIGMCAAFGLARFIASLLLGVTTWDPAVFLSVPLLLLSAALLAVWLPARRAMRIDPIQALRAE